MDARNKPARQINKQNLTETRIYLRQQLQLSAEDVERVCKISNVATQTVQQLQPKFEVMIKHLNLSPGRLGELLVTQPKIFALQKADRMERRIMFWVNELDAADGLFFNNPWVLGIPISVVQKKLDLIDSLNWSKDSKKLMRSCPSFVNMSLNQIEERMHELEEILDLDRERVVDVLQRYPIILNHQPAFLEERVVSWFKRKGFEPETIGDLIRSQPRMLLGQVHLLKRNWATLHMLGLNTDLVKRVFKYCGQVFRVSLEKENQLCKLRYVLMRLERPPAQVLQQFPLLFQYNLWLRIAPRIYILQSRRLNTHNLMKYMIPGNRKFAILKARSNVDLYEEWLLNEWLHEIWPKEKEKVEMLDIPLFHVNY